MVLPRLNSGDSLLDLGACMGQDLRKCVFDGAPADRLYASDLFAEYEDLSYELWNDRTTVPQGHYLTDDILADNDRFIQGALMTKLGPGMTDMIVINMFLHLFDYENQLRVATRILRLLSHRPGSLILGSQAGVRPAMEQPLKPPFDKTEDGHTRTIFRHSPTSFIELWEKAAFATGVPIKASANFQRSTSGGMDTGYEVEAKETPFTADDLFSTSPPKRISSSKLEARRLYFSIIRT
ncbi:hypothetical protein MMC28_007238 [Mycoblastus sanguinarius]|nr:hypothetical protein [Mycoblastus sanguinarius]